MPSLWLLNDSPCSSVAPPLDPFSKLCCSKAVPPLFSESSAFPCAVSRSRSGPPFTSKLLSALPASALATPSHIPWRGKPTAHHRYAQGLYGVNTVNTAVQ